MPIFGSTKRWPTTELNPNLLPLQLGKTECHHNRSQNPGDVEGSPMLLVHVIDRRELLTSHHDKIEYSVEGQKQAHWSLKEPFELGLIQKNICKE